MKYILTLSFLICTALLLQAQQDPQNTFFMYNQAMYNPGSVGSKDYASVNAIYRQQWVGFDGAPVSQMLTFDAPLAGDRVGIGITLRHYTIGINTDWRASMAYSYKMQLTPDAVLRFGIQGSVHYLGMDFNGNDIVTDKDNDQSFINQPPNRYTGNVGAGLYFNLRNTLWVGVSTPAFYPVTLGNNDDVLVTATEAPHFYGSCGGLLDMSEKVQFKPSLLFKYTPNAPLDADVNASVVFNRSFLLGATYGFGGDGSGENVDFLAGYHIFHNLMLGVAYGVPISGLSDTNDGSFEIMLRYDVKSEEGDLENPRFFN